MGLAPPLYLLLCFGIVTVSWVAAQDDWDVVMARVHQAAMNSSSHEDLDHLLSLLQPNGSFSDINYGEGNSTPFRDHGRRLSALGYHYHNGADVAQNLTTSFYFITYDAPPNQDSNWWGHLIGTPTDMWEGAVLARDVIPTTLLTDFLNRGNAEEEEEDDVEEKKEEEEKENVKESDKKKRKKEEEEEGACSSGSSSTIELDMEEVTSEGGRPTKKRRTFAVLDSDDDEDLLQASQQY